MINIFYFLLIYLGACIGSFLNVLVIRLPLEKDTIFLASHCDSCGTKLKWYMNLPIIAFALQKGKCRYCGAKISIQHFLFEITFGLIFFCLFIHFDFFALNSGLDYSIFVSKLLIICALIVHIVIDFKHQLLLDKINIFLIPFCIFLGVVQLGWLESLLGSVFGFGLTYLITFVYFKVRGVIGLGGGDIKLFGVVGFLLGIYGTSILLIFSSITGVIHAICMMLFKNNNLGSKIPFGPSIIIWIIIEIIFPGTMNNLFDNALGHG